MVIKGNSLDLMSTIAEFCICSCGICTKFWSAFMSYSPVSSPLILQRELKILAYT